MILQLAGEGKLSLDDPVSRWLPGVVTGNGNDGRRVTVRILWLWLWHTSVPGDRPTVPSPHAKGYTQWVAGGALTTRRCSFRLLDDVVCGSD